MTKKAVILCAAMTAFAGCRYATKERASLAEKPCAIATAKTVESQGESRPIEAQDDCIVAGLGEFSVADLLSLNTNVSTMVASTNLGVAVARELKRRYDWIKIYVEPWEFDGCRHTKIDICNIDHNFGFSSASFDVHNGDYPFAEIHAKTSEMSGPGRFFVSVSFRQGGKWIVDWEKSSAQRPVFIRAKNGVGANVGIKSDVGAVPIDEVSKSREEWVRKHGGVKTVVQFSEDSAELPGTLCGAAPKEPKLLDTSGNFALYSGETAADVASNKMRYNGDCPYHNSLFLRRRKADGTNEWRVLLTTGSNWREATGMSEWCSSQSSWLKDHFYIMAAKFGSDRHHLWLVCNTHIPLWNVACSYDVQTDEFRALIDGDTADEQPDGTILVAWHKFYPKEDDGRGAAWRDVWLTPDGKIVRKGEIILRGADL